MISQQDLDILRCPLDPSHTRLEQVPGALVCQRCRLKFSVRDDIPCMLAEEAELPPGCESLADLPCQKVPAPESRP